MKNNFLQQMVKVLDLALESCDGNISELARRLDTNKAKVSHWKNQKSLPNLESASQLAEMTGAQIVLPNQSVRDYARLLQVDDLDAFRHGRNLQTEPGTPVSVLEYVGQKQHRRPDLLFSLDLLEKLGVDAADALLFEVANDAMHPVINRGDQLLIDTSKTQVEDGKIYLIHSTDYFLLRYVSRDLSGELVLHTPGHIPEMRVLPESLNLLGQVVWVGKKL